MALALSIEICKGNGCTSILLTELTGAYNDPLNTTGWGTPNPELGTVTETKIKVTLPGGTIVEILNPAGLPSDNPLLSYEILAPALNAAWTNLVDGQYIFEYIVTADASTYTTGPIPFLYVCNLECCIKNMWFKVADSSDCSCDSTLIKNAQYASALLYALKANGSCGNTTVINSLITKLQQICGLSNTDCGCN